jgi:two-component system, NtrC family, nitrogen regulation response regulator GlnG
MERTLIARGLYGESCTSGNEALTILRQTEFHVVIANLNMLGISGMALLEEVCTQFPQVALVIVTGSDDVLPSCPCVQSRNFGLSLQTYPTG